MHCLVQRARYEILEANVITSLTFNKGLKNSFGEYYTTTHAPPKSQLFKNSEALVLSAGVSNFRSPTVPTGQRTKLSVKNYLEVLHYGNSRALVATAPQIYVDRAAQTLASVIQKRRAPKKIRDGIKSKRTKTIKKRNMSTILPTQDLVRLGSRCSLKSANNSRRSSRRESILRLEIKLHSEFLQTLAQEVNIIDNSKKLTVDFSPTVKAELVNKEVALNSGKQPSDLIKVSLRLSDASLRNDVQFRTLEIVTDVADNFNSVCCSATGVDNDRPTTRGP